MDAREFVDRRRRAGGAGNGGRCAGGAPRLRDSDNLPFSNSKSEGFENKIAEVIAADLGKKLSTTGGRISAA